MPSTRSYPAITLTEPKFPYVISNEDAEPTSFVSIGLVNPFDADIFGLNHSHLFFIAGGELTSLGPNSTGVEEHQIVLRHSLACDVERRRSQIAVFAFKSLQLAPSFRRAVSFNGWLVNAQFYPARYEDEEGPLNPFEGVTLSDNYRFRSSPPNVSFNGMFSFPLEVNVSIHHNQTDVQRMLSQWEGK
jgi:hypothetical protein